MMGDMQAAPTSSSDRSDDKPGATGPGIVRLDLIGTGVFVASAVLSAVFFTGPLRAAGVVVALVLFSIGVVAFLWSYWTAVQRSRTENIAVAQLYFLAGGSTPASVRRPMNLALLVQVIVGLSTAIARNSTDGRAGSTLAFGILVPMFGLGLNGLWCSKFGSFSPRVVPSVPTSPDQMEQTSHHG